MKPTLRAAIRSILFQGSALLAVGNPALSAELPVTCVAGACGAAGPSSWVTSGAATSSATQDTLTINQSSDRAVLNWSSFNVSADGRVVFNQPNANSIALNRIFQDSASRIFGAVEANGQIYLVNPNGFVFGRTARINAAGILASTLSLSDEVFAAGLLSPNLIQTGTPALGSNSERLTVLDANGAPVLDANGQPLEVRLVVEEGARLESRGAGGRVLLAGPKVDNAGTISAADGQVIVAAGSKVFLQASGDPALRGLLVEVDQGGEAWNRLTGTISAARGNVTVAGLAVNQAGRVSASTTVEANGSVRLLARDNPLLINAPDGSTDLGPGQNGGRLEIGGTSTTDILPERDNPATAVDDQVQLASQIELSGREVYLRAGSQIVAPGGELGVMAAANPSAPALYDATARIRMESGAQIDVSGSDATLPMSRNLVAVELRANELRDSPAQRNGALRGQTVFVDARATGQREDGSVWRGTPLADVEGALAAIPKSIAERTAEGGSVIFASEGDVVIADGALVDVSGGVVTYEDGPLRTSQLIGADGRLYDIGEADPARTYVGVLNPGFRRADDRWGYVETATAPGIGLLVPGYVEGSDAGSVQFAAPNLVLNGSLTGTAITGPYQRNAGQAPQGGQLVVGVPEPAGQGTPDYRAPSISFSLQGIAVAVADDAAYVADQPLLLPMDYLLRGGFTRTALYSNGTITVPDSTPMALLPGSSLSMNGHRVDIMADITATGGSIEATSLLTAGTGGVLPRAGVQVGPQVTLDVRGNWTNDATAALLDPATRASTPVFTAGGSVSLATDVQDAELVIGNEVQLLANGGAWIDRNGSIRAGNGGSIEINAGSLGAALEIGNSVGIEAFGLLGAQGGALELTAPQIAIGSAPVWASAQRIDPAGGTFDFLNLGSALFAEHGFRSIALSASGGVDRAVDPDALRVLAGTTIDHQVSVLQLREASTQAGSAANVADLVTRVLPPQNSREPTELALQVVTSGINDASRIGRLNLAAGSSIVAGPGSSVALSSVGGILVEGLVRAPAGIVRLTTETPAEAVDSGYRADLQIQLGLASVLDVSGTAVYQPNDGNLLDGSLFDAGSIELRAERGSVLVDNGAVINISGASAEFDRIAPDTGGYRRERIGSNAGELSVVAPEAIVLDGTLLANAGDSDVGRGRGGALSVQLTRDRGFASPSQYSDTYPVGPRVLRVTADGAQSGDPLPANGLAVVSQSLIGASGIDALGLEADRIEFDSVNIALERSLVLDTPTMLLRDGATVTLSAPYVALGNTIASRTAGDAVSGTGTLTVRGEFIEAIGGSTIAGANSTVLTSAGDLRLREIVASSGRVGSLQVAGNLTLAAAQIYPATLTQFAVTASGDPGTRLRIEQTTAAAAPPLSAGGTLTLNAPRIEHAGTLLAPFGTLVLNAGESLQLAANSLTSVSANDLVIPFGRVDNGAWVYEQVSTTAVTAVPGRQITLAAPEVNTASGAVIDLRGGGDLYAYEWIPGTGGTEDALGNDAGVNRYAVLPSLRNQFAPYDYQASIGSDLSVGASVYLEAAPGLEAGFYPLLPARYVLLPGAYLVEAVPDTGNLQPGSVASLPDGAPVVAGYRTFGATGLGGTRYSGFAIRPGSYGRELATYQDSFASQYFADRAARLEAPRPRLPGDAGTLSLLPAQALEMLGTVELDAAPDGRAGRVEVAATNIEVVAANALPTPGVVQLSATILSGWRAGEIWIGGTRAQDTGDIVVAAEQVRIGSGASLTADEIVLLARTAVMVEGGASLSTTASAAQSIDRDQLAPLALSLQGDYAGAAALGVSDLAQLSVTRGSYLSLAPGAVTLASGSSLASGGSLLVDAPASVLLNGDLRADGGSWWLGSDSVRFSEAVPGAGLGISNALLARIASAGSLTLSSTNAIEFEQAVSLGSQSSLDELSLNAAVLTNLAGADVSFRSGTVRLQGRSALAPVVGGTGVLTVSANTLELGPGNLDVQGFAGTALTALGDLTGIGDTTLQVGGNLQLTATRITGSSGGNTRILAPGATVSIARPQQPTTAEGNGNLGAALTIAADVIEHRGTLYAPSGLIELEAATRLSVDAGGVLDSSGQFVSAAARVVGSDGGELRLASGGTLAIANGATLDVSGGEAADAGDILLYAAGAADVAGQLLAQASTVEQRGGAFDLRAATVTDFAGLNARLAAGGFAERQSIHVSAGDLLLAAGQQVTARNIEWTTDGGLVAIDGALIAPSGLQRSAIRLQGGAGVAVGTAAQLLADGNARFGGDIDIGTSNGSLAIAAGSLISARGNEQSGTLRLRAPATSGDVAITTLAGNVANAQVVVEPFAIYDIVAVPSTVEFDAVRAQTDAYFAGAAGNIRARLDPLNSLAIRIEPGVELRHDGDLQLGDFDLTAWRFDARPAALTVRATGSITVNGTVSDGFGSEGAGPLLRPTLLDDDSATLRFAAGADFASADPLAVARGASADFTIASSGLVRTGTGDLTIVAARDIVFAGEGANVYTGGRPAQPSQVNSSPLGASVSFADRGGNLALTAGRDVVGAAVAQGIGSWQRRQGTADDVALPRPTQWGIDVRAFDWNAGTLGGGQLSVSAARDVTNFSAAAADSAIELTPNALTRYGGGALSIEAGRDVASATLYVARGSGTIDAAGALNSGRTGANGDPLGTLVLVGDAQVDVTSRGTLALESVVNPTALAQVGVPSTQRSVFFTYGGSSAVSARSSGGDVVLDPHLEDFFGSAVVNASGATINVLPSSVALSSLSGDVILGASRILFPSDRGQLDLFAARDIVARNFSALTMSDAAAGIAPTPLQPVAAVSILPFEFSASARHATDTVPVLITAGRDIVGATFAVPKVTHLQAGRDIRDTSLRGQNLRPGDITSIQAGRDIAYAPDLVTAALSVGGPGRFDVIAARNLDLGFSRGITTVGRLTNPAIQSDAGAALNVLVGMGRDLDAGTFVDSIVAASADLRQQLIDFTAAATGSGPLSWDEAAAAFKGLDAERQRPLLLETFFGELVASGREANADATAGFERGYRAIDALFPGSRATDRANPFDGDLTLAFSRIYTLAGGDVSLVVPGGLVNVGLANPPASIGARPASELGIVAQRAGSVRVFAKDDVLVNSSRIFTLLGGDIAIWSTTGDIDAGRGAKSSVSAPPPAVLVDAEGRVTIDFAGAVAGSGIRTIATDETVAAGDVDLIAPSGVVNAGDAGIGSAGNLNIAAQQVVGLDNIQVGGVSTGVPAETSGLGASLAGVSAVGSSTTSAATGSVAGETEEGAAAAPLAQSALSWLEVFVIGLGEENCRPQDLECLKRQQSGE